MKSLVLSQFDSTWLTAIAFVLFVCVFIGVFYLTYVRNNNKDLEKLKYLPFENGENHGK